MALTERTMSGNQQIAADREQKSLDLHCFTKKSAVFGKKSIDWHSSKP